MNYIRLILFVMLAPLFGLLVAAAAFIALLPCAVVLAALAALAIGASVCFAVVMSLLCLTPSEGLIAEATQIKKDVTESRAVAEGTS